MSDDERVLRSFVAEDEEWRDSWTVTQVKRSKGHLPPSAVGEETVAVTDDRVLWFQDDLDEVAIDALEDVESEYVEQQAAPPMVMGGGLLFVLGIFASIGGFIAGVESTLLLVMPALTGLGVFLGTRVLANVTGQEGDTREGYRMRLWVDGDPVSIWGHDEDTMEALEIAITDQLGGETSDPRDEGDRRGAEEDVETIEDDDDASPTESNPVAADDEPAE